MKKIFVLLALVLLLPACSYLGRDDDKKINKISDSQANLVCTAPNATSTASTTSKKDILPPVNQEEKNKTFTYEDSETGVKMKYPGSCYFNKGVFQCSDFTMSIWVLDPGLETPPSPEINFKEAQNETEVKYYFKGKAHNYIVVAWYEGKDRKDLESIIDKIAKTFTY